MIITRKEILNDIDFLSLPISVVYLSQSQSIAWLTFTSLMIFHPLYKENIYKPFCLISSNEYDVVHDHYCAIDFEGQSYFLALY